MFLKIDGIHYFSNFYRKKLYNKEKKLYLLTTDDGSFIFLNSSALKQLKKGFITDEQLFKNLEEKFIIVTSQNSQSLIHKTQRRYSFLQNGTSLHIVIPTSRCNLGCKYCFAAPDPIDANKDEHDLDEKTAKQIIEFIMNSPSNAITIEFQGGEATARFDLVKVMALHAKELNKVAKKDLRLTIVSNLTLMTEEMAKWLVKNEITICTSLDGPKQVHDKNRIIHAKEGTEIGTYEKVVYWIRKINNMYLKEHSSYRVNALMTITKHSLPYYKEIIDEYMRLGIYLVNIRPLTIVGKATQKELPFHYSQQEFIQFYNNSLQYIKTLNKQGVKAIEKMRQMYLDKVLENSPTYHADFESPCGAATGQIVYHSNGDIYTCHEALGREEFKIGNVHKDKWQDLFKREETSKAILNSMLENNVRCDRCVYKPYCGTCMVENFYNFGKFNFYPTKTTKHHETIAQCESIFDDILKNLKVE